MKLALRCPVSGTGERVVEVVSTNGPMWVVRLTSGRVVQVWHGDVLSVRE
jgi:hypothetical protein